MNPQSRSELDAAWEWFARESDGEFPDDVPDAELLAQFRAANRRRRIRRVVLGVVAAVTFLGILLYVLLRPAQAHDFWINHGNYKAADGASCCGKNDCEMFASDQVKAGKTGWLILPLQEIVPYSETQGSEDGAFWRCKRYDGSRRCFFAPQPGS